MNYFALKTCINGQLNLICQRKGFTYFLDYGNMIIYSKHIQRDGFMAGNKKGKLFGVGGFMLCNLMLHIEM